MQTEVSQRGITLIEMLVVVVIIGLFVGLVSTNMFKKADEAKRTAARANISTFMQGLGFTSSIRARLSDDRARSAGAAREARGSGELAGAVS